MKEIHEISSDCKKMFCSTALPWTIQSIIRCLSVSDTTPVPFLDKDAFVMVYLALSSVVCCGIARNLGMILDLRGVAWCGTTASLGLTAPSGSP